jgi:quercetin dioxygenase-like cupin family protein
MTEKLNLTHGTQFAPGSIVSKVLLRKSAGTVTFFAFDAGQELSEHTAPFDAAMHVLEGKLQIRIAQENHELQDGDFLVMPANIPHALKAAAPTKAVLTMFKAES